MKRCSRCGKEKPLEGFERASDCKNGRVGVCLDCRNLDRRTRRKIPGEARDKMLAKQRERKLLAIGWTPERWSVVNYAQGGLCYLCGESDYSRGVNRNLSSDHSHDTGEPRSLLCYHCNTRLSWVEEIGLDSLKQYLKL